MNEENRNEKKKLPTWGKILISIGAIVLVVLIAFGGYSWYLLNSIRRGEDYSGTQQEKFDQDENTNGLEEIDPNDINWDNNAGSIKSKEGVYNILMLGEQRDKTEKRGRTDTMMIATINTNENALKITSLMRETYVQIPGYKDNRVNTAFRTGGIDLLYKTIEQNYKIKPDGYIKVDYDSFEDIINLLGGVKITLTAKEANYLNTTNYISKKQYRTVKEGTQVLNGNQALGYSRIRHVVTGNGLNGDFGRTYRQRTVLNAIFDAYSKKGIAENLTLASKMLSYLTTDISNMELLSYAKTAISLNASDLQNITIPIPNSYKMASIRGMSVIVPNFPENRTALHDFLYGPDGTTNQ